jgi:hypothetical protein
MIIINSAMLNGNAENILITSVTYVSEEVISKF